MTNQHPVGAAPARECQEAKAIDVMTDRTLEAYHNRMAELRVADTATRQMLLDVANTYDRLAEQLERLRDVQGKR